MESHALLLTVRNNPFIQVCGILRYQTVHPHALISGAYRTAWARVLRMSCKSQTNEPKCFTSIFRPAFSPMFSKFSIWSTASIFWTFAGSMFPHSSAASPSAERSEL